MDIQRPASVAQAKKRRQYMFGAVGILVIVLVSVVLARLKPAAPTVERATVWVDIVKRGPMVRQVRGLGTLVPVDEARRWVPASTQGRVEKIIMRPGVQVTPDTVVLELSDPNVQQALERCRTATARRRSRLQQPESPARRRNAESARCRGDRQGRLREREDRTRDERGTVEGKARVGPGPEAVGGPRGIARHARQDRNGSPEGFRGQCAGAARSRRRRISISVVRTTICGARRSINSASAPA